MSQYLENLQVILTFQLLFNLAKIGEKIKISGPKGKLEYKGQGKTSIKYLFSYIENENVEKKNAIQEGMKELELRNSERSVWSLAGPELLQCISWSVKSVITSKTKPKWVSCLQIKLKFWILILPLKIYHKRMIFSWEMTSKQLKKMVVWNFIIHLIT